MSNLLDRRDILLIRTQLAMDIGLNEAILLQQVSYWLEDTNSGVEHDGQRWIYNTLEQWAKQFPFWSVTTIQRTIVSLREMGLLRVEKLAAVPRDRTNYYTIDRRQLDLLHGAKLTSSNTSIWRDVSDKTETTQRLLTPSRQNDVTEVHKKKAEPDRLFEHAWSLYPRRVGGNPKNSAQQAWNARVKSGVDPEVMLAGVQRYAKYCELDGSIGSKFVKQAVTFFGKDEHYLEPWDYAERAAPARNSRTAENDRRAAQFRDSMNDGWMPPGDDGLTLEMG